MKLYSYIFGLLLFLALFQSSPITSKSAPKKKPSPIEQLQQAINETQRDIEEYYAFTQKNQPIQNVSGKIKDETANFEKSLNSLGTLNDLLSVRIENLVDKKKSSYETYQKSPAQIDTVLDLYNNEVKRFNASKDRLTRYEEFLELENKYEVSKKKLTAISEVLHGVVKFQYNYEDYIGYVVDMNKEKISTYQDHEGNQLYETSLASAYKYYGKNSTSVSMVTNAGMFQPNHYPEGILIMDSIEYAPIDTLSVKAKITPNFYLKPNGVFFEVNGSYFINETTEFNEAYSKGAIKPRIATQSGPMLVHNGIHHPKFNHESRSRKLRSGLGIMPNGNVVFLISKEHHTNFFQFATLFKDVFGCQEALFLDGVISKMSFKEMNLESKSGNFGPILVVHDLPLKNKKKQNEKD